MDSHDAMSPTASQKLSQLVQAHRDPLLANWRLQVRGLPSARHLDIPTLNDHIPSLLDELAGALHASSEQSIPEAMADPSAPAHGLQRVQDGFDIEEVVAEYNILRGCVHNLGSEHGVQLQGEAFHILNRVFDQAIGQALQTYARQRALEAQQRREEYLAFVVHDLRTPLFAISLAALVFERTVASQGVKEDVQRVVKSLRRNVVQLEGLVRKVLDENKHLQTNSGVRIERRRFDLWPLVQALREDLHTVATTAQTQLINEVPDELVVFADAELLRRVLQNLVANAIKFAPGGDVVIGAQVDETRSTVECWVRDNGPGIAAEMVGKVFDKGESGAEDIDTSGLGLAIVKSFVEAHGGNVSVETEAGVGSTFRFVLPGQGPAR